MTDTEKAEYEGIIRMLTTKLEELAGENERLRSEGGAYAALRGVFLNRDIPETLRVKAATAALPHEKPRLMPERAPLDLTAEESEPLAAVVERQRARQNLLCPQSTDQVLDVVPRCGWRSCGRTGAAEARPDHSITVIEVKF
jgi:hypothetical protein